MKQKRKRTLIIAAIALAAAAGGGFYFSRREKPQKVRVARAETVEELKAVVTGSGEVRTHNSVDIQTEIAGVIVELPVREGDRVKKGQVLLKIDPFQTEADVQSARAQLAALEAEAAGQTAQIATSEANAARDEFLKKSAEVEQRQAETNLARTRTQLKREKELLDSKLLSDDQYEIMETQLKLNQAQVEAAAAKIDQFDAQMKAAKALVDSAKATRDAVMRRVDGARSSLLRAEDLLKKTTIHSTLDGVIVKLNVEAGERAVPGILSNPQATLMTIADFSVIEAELKVDETDIVGVKLDDIARVVVDALPEHPLTGRVVEVGNSPILTGASGGGGGGMGGSSQEGKDFKVVVQIDAPPESLRPGMSCEADITTSVKHDVLVIPIQALTVREAKVDADGRFIAPAESKGEEGRTAAADSARDRLKELQGVFLFTPGKKARFVPVPTGITGEMDIEVLEGLSAGDEVVVGPLKALRSLKEGDGLELDQEHPYRRSSRRRVENPEDPGNR